MRPGHVFQLPAMMPGGLWQYLTALKNFLVLLGLVPTEFLHKKMHFQLCVFNTTKSQIVLHTTKSQIVAELFLEGGESKLNMLEVSTRCWQNHSQVTSKLRSLWYPDCSSKKHSWEIGSKYRVGGEGGRGWMSLSRSPVLWRQRRGGEGFTEGVS